MASFSENTPENHLRKKPGRVQVTDLKILVENGLIPSGGRLLKTPTAQLAVNGGSQDPAKRRDGGHGPTLADQVEHELLPTPTASLGKVEATAPWKPGVQWWLQSRAARNVAAIAERVSAGGIVDWGIYSRAILRWQQVTGRMVPSPTVMSPKGNQVLSLVFLEWMMGLEEGWVTFEDIGLSRKDLLMILGNGVVPQQAVLAVSLLLARLR